MSPAPAASFDRATLRLGDRTLWRELDFTIEPGELVAVLGANGAGKSSLLRVLLGQQQLTAGRVSMGGVPVRRGSREVGFIPQRIAVDPLIPLRARDLVRLGVDGHRYGMGFWRAKKTRARVDALLDGVGVGHLADAPVSQLSGGELQRVRIAEALAGRPGLLLCDEPLAALDVAQQRKVVGAIDRYRRSRTAAVLFITHDINSVLDIADRVLYLASGGYRLGTPDEVLTSQALTDLYGSPVDVFRTQGRVVVVSAADPGAGQHVEHDPSAGHHVERDPSAGHHAEHDPDADQHAEHDPDADRGAPAPAAMSEEVL